MHWLYAVRLLLNGNLPVTKSKTSWGEQLDPKNVLPEYPRPIMERNDWKNLNGLWKYAITPKGTPAPATYQGDILVPFAVESSLSGVGKMINEKKKNCGTNVLSTFLLPGVVNKSCCISEQ